MRKSPRNPLKSDHLRQVKGKTLRQVKGAASRQGMGMRRKRMRKRRKRREEERLHPSCKNPGSATGHGDKVTLTL